MSEITPTIPVEALGTVVPPGAAIPSGVTFASHSQELLYLYGKGDVRQSLWAMDIESGIARVLIAPPGGGLDEENLTPEEVLRRQRLRQHSTGITRFQQAKDADCLLIPLDGLYISDSSGAPLRKILDKAVQNPVLDNSGKWVAYGDEGAIYVLPIEGSEPRQLTFGGQQEGITDGLAEFMAQEELGRMEGFWWSPDSQWIAFIEVDERHIPQFRILHSGKASLGPEAQEDHRYPFAGQANAHLRLAVISRAGGNPVWMELDYDEEIYIARVFWWSDGRLGAEILNRPQTWLKLLAFDGTTGESTCILREENEFWVDMRRKHLLTLSDDSFLWASERSGFNHIYYYNREGSLLCPLTEGEWQVDDLLCVDEANGLVYFTGNREHPTEKSLYSVPLAGGDVRRITQAVGTHNITISPDFGCFVDVYSSTQTPFTVTLRSLADDALLHTLHTPDDPRLQAYDLPAPEIVSLQNRDGTTLYGALYRPPQHFQAPYPTVIFPYGGPGPQIVGYHWGLTASLLSQYLRERGFAVFRLDNRGSARRGIAFEGALKNRMGSVEIDDQVDGVRWLVEQGITDPARVGIHGYSYGGYMTLMGLFKAPDVFKVGIAGAPVVHWDGYDTAYTERYMGTPQSNPEGYEQGSPIHFVNNLQGKLLLIHGLLDENVHFRHTARLIQALTDANKDYDLLLLPEERHSPRFEAGRLYLWSRIARYFETHL